ncbi:MAG: DUF1802 family protein [Verrucomicrobiota bacterium]
MRVAFKEWAVVVDALGAGQQILILRKGGISEGRRGFQVEHAEFFLFPTFFHEQRDAILQSARERYDAVHPSPPSPAVVQLNFFAHVVAWGRLDSLAAGERFQGQHILRNEVVAQRFQWGKEKNIYAMAVRVFRLAETVHLPLSPSYSGCKSWVDLEQEIPTDSATPVLSKEEFNARLDEFQAALASPDAEQKGPMP